MVPVVFNFDRGWSFTHIKWHLYPLLIVFNSHPNYCFILLLLVKKCKYLVIMCQENVSCFIDYILLLSVKKKGQMAQQVFKHCTFQLCFPLNVDTAFTFFSILALHFPIFVRETICFHFFWFSHHIFQLGMPNRTLAGSPVKWSKLNKIQKCDFRFRTKNNTMSKLKNMWKYCVFCAIYPKKL